jgi:uncharacterized protein YkwD
MVVGPASVAADAGYDCLPDDKLRQAAAELLLAARPPTPEEIAKAVSGVGDDAVGVHALLVDANQFAQLRTWMGALRERGDGKLSCGRASSEAGELWLVAARAGGLEPLDAQSTTVRGWIAEGFANPKLVVADANGQLERIAIDADRLKHGISVADTLARPARVQLVATGPRGPRPIAERTLPTRREAAAPTHDPDRWAAGLPVTDQLMRLRRMHGRSGLRDNRLLSKVADSHAAAACAQGRVAHVIDGDGPEQRMARAGLRARRVGEAVARAEDSDAAFAAMRRSPSHRMTLLEQGFTDVGVGTASDRNQRMCLVVLLAAWPQPIPR